MRTAFDALIIGAGPAGSATAIQLARAGWSVALIEKQEFPRRKVCGECIAASNLPLLDALGIGTELDTRAGPDLRRVALLRGERTVEAALPAARHPKYPWGRALGRETLDTLLLAQARAAGAEILQPWSAQSISGSAGAWRCEVRAAGAARSMILRAPVTIAAHGSWEPLAAQRDWRRRTHQPGDLFGFKASFRGAALPAGVLPVLSLDGGYGGMVLADGGITTVACCIRRDRLDALRARSPGLRAGAAVEAWLRRECAGVQRALRGASPDGPWLSVGPLDPGIRLRADDTLFRVGNAAGEAHPILGEGMSMALQSAAMLCTELLTGRRRAAMPDATRQAEVARCYTREWRRHFAPRLRLGAAFAHAAMRPGSAALLMALARSWPGLLTYGAAWAGKARSAVDLRSVE